MANVVSVIRTAQFNAAHRLNVPEWSELENKAYFGLCNNANYHGHNYELHVTITGPVDPVSGYMIDLKLVKDWIEDDVVKAFDHRNLNLDTEEFRHLNPTAENIAVVIWQKLSKRLNPEMKLLVKLYETPRNYVEFDGTQS
jgi:6-pyruvoyltetrahydropterin/6-carboxytetrahydropterin synthase